MRCDGSATQRHKEIYQDRTFFGAAMRPDRTGKAKLHQQSWNDWT